MNIPSIPAKSGKLGFAMDSIFALPEPYKTLLGHVVNIREVQPSNLKELKMVLNKKWVNLPQKVFILE